MNTLRMELIKHSNFLSNVRKTQENFMQITHDTGSSRNTGGQHSNKRYKRSSEELEKDINKVDQLVASGKFNQIEALKHVGLQSSVYHYKKRQLHEPVAKSLKPRKFAHRIRNNNKEDYAMRKKELMKKMETNKQQKIPENTKAFESSNEVEKLRMELEAYKTKYNKLKEYVVENVILG